MVTNGRRGCNATASGSKVVLPQARPYPKALPSLADSGYKSAGADVLAPIRKPARWSSKSTSNPERADARPIERVGR